MGLLPADAVEPLTLLADLRDDAGLPSARYTRASPRVTHEVTVRATARSVAVGAIIAVEGPRDPAAGVGARDLRQAWIYVGRDAPEPWAVDVLAALQAAWPAQYRRATRGLATVSTALDPR